ncbi:endonuclease/exonuclease/phosphatase family protein [Fusibacillus kribbianus]|uniref:Endonuclease/exonuclease/phosphatase domain-containing protein n=1 Tax=Fusibacillus kribbianus TaxID=3044208 RepID=A0AAP4BBZ7_9FIRM|nr:hypothetical protein [Ruminococcus sp. YH-rum2234]MDI9241821.1 hypothetical protein [Ruminococcus sp. YH-rum2234]
MSIKKILGSLLALCLMLSLLPSAAYAVDSQGNSGTFTAASMNVDGLPNSILGISINSDGPGSDGTKAISAKLNEMQWDIIGVSEDFNYNTELLSSLSSYSSGTHRGGISGLRNNTDGLNLLWKNTISVTGEKWTSWNTYYSTGIFGTGNGADGMIDKGYRFYQATVAEGVTVDVYILHMDADSDAGDISARESQLTQLADAIKASDNKNPIIVMGDTNCRYTREHLETLFIDAINADSRFTIQDAWVEKVRNGVYPTYGADAIVAKDKGGSYDYPEAEIVDKLFYINNTDSAVTLTANSYSVVTTFTDSEGTALADHWPILVDFAYTVKGQEHTHSYTLTSETAPTCTEPGSKTYTCSACDDSYTETITAQGHAYENGVCTRCGDPDPDAATGAEPVYTLGDSTTEIISGEKYAIVFPSAIPYSLNHSESGAISAGTIRLTKEDEVPADLIWTLTKQDKGYTISAEINGETKYLARTKNLTNGGYKIALQDDPFVWTVTASDSNGRLRVTTKVISRTYTLRYYTTKTGWIVAGRGDDIQIYQVNR